MQRPKIIRICTVTLLGLAVLVGNVAAQQKSLKEQLVGAWTLVSVEVTAKDGTKSGRNLAPIQEAF